MTNRWRGIFCTTSAGCFALWLLDCTKTSREVSLVLSRRRCLGLLCDVLPRLVIRAAVDAPRSIVGNYALLVPFKIKASVSSALVLNKLPRKDARPCSRPPGDALRRRARRRRGAPTRTIFVTQETSTRFDVLPQLLPHLWPDQTRADVPPPL